MNFWVIKVATTGKLGENKKKTILPVKRSGQPSKLFKRTTMSTFRIDWLLGKKNKQEREFSHSAQEATYPLHTTKPG
jgi:hypothetical protein